MHPPPLKLVANKDAGTLSSSDVDQDFRSVSIIRIRIQVAKSLPKSLEILNSHNKKTTKITRWFIGAYIFMGKKGQYSD